MPTAAERRWRACMAHGDREWKSGGSRGEPEQGPARGQGQSQGWLLGLSLRNRLVRAVRRALLRAVGGRGGVGNPDPLRLCCPAAAHGCLGYSWSQPSCHAAVQGESAQPKRSCSPAGACWGTAPVRCRLHVVMGTCCCCSYLPWLDICAAFS